MKNRLHTVLTLAATAALWTGCGDSIATLPDEPAGSAILFSCDEVKSRVQETGVDNIASFRVSAVWAKASGEYMDNFMEGLHVEKKGENWAYSPVYYMPTDGGSVDFFAYSPAMAPVTDFEISGENHDRISFAYDVTTDLSMQHDFMVAEALGKKTSPIFLEFRHVLSWVTIRARSASAGYNFRVREVKLINFCREGVLNGITSATEPRETLWTWSNQTTPATYTIAQNGIVDVIYNPIPSEYTLVSDSEDNPLMILPQTVERGSAAVDPDNPGPGAYAVVTYDVVDGNSVTVEKNVTYYAPVTDPNDPDKGYTFEMGRKYALRIDLRYPL